MLRRETYLVGNIQDIWLNPQHILVEKKQHILPCQNKLVGKTSLIHSRRRAGVLGVCELHPGETW